MRRNLVYMVLLLTIVWLMFLAASSIVATVVLPVLEGSDQNIFFSVARTVTGVVVFAIWLVVWQKLAEFWLYRILFRRG